MPRSLNDETQFLKDLVHEVGETILKPKHKEAVQGTYELRCKDDGKKRDFAGEADTEAETYITKRLRNHDSGATIIGEEDGRTLRDRQRAYIFDPLDGTGIHGLKVQEYINSAAGQEELRRLGLKIIPGDFKKYCTFITRTEENEPNVAAAYVPETGEMLFAIKGGGAYYSSPGSSLTRLRIEDPRSIDDAIVGVGLPSNVFKPTYQKRYAKVFDTIEHFGGRHKFGFTSAIFETSAPALPREHPHKTHAYLHPQIYMWDIMWLLVKEAGGLSMMITEHDGRLDISEFSYEKFDIFNEETDIWRQPYAVATGHPRVIEAFAERLQETA